MGKYNVLVGDITSDEILKDHDLIINPTNPYMLNGSGVCGAIFDKAGKKELEEYTTSHYKNKMEVGEIRITPGFNLGMDIMFVQGPKFYDYPNPIDKLIETYQILLNALKMDKYTNILLPSLGTGIYGYHHEDVGKLVNELLTSFVKDNNINIDFVLFNLDDKKYYE